MSIQQKITNHGANQLSKTDSGLLGTLKKENNLAKGPEDPYVKLIINRQRKQMLIMACFIVFIAFLVILNRAKIEEASWLVSALPIMGLGIIVALIPPIEEWEYIPWQTSARQYEKHQIER